ncbi:hypothetical protein DUI87_08761 [Hirundo rustica rustica]|uniref:Peptidase S1 domain-containing protein n=1 Tax=Hirundo rustica rustica TaxID=333673 RepID=A0A3M0KKR7_HIRRU|nr:hypothetical protein DUI87_08761 [Hirundo rustica rustica]
MLLLCLLVLLAACRPVQGTWNSCENISAMRLLIGATQLTEPGPGAEVRLIKRLLVHKEYGPADQSNDIALLELNEPVQCGPYIQLGCVPNATLNVALLEDCYVAGWGATTARSQRSSDILQEAKVHLINVQLCNSSKWYDGDVHTHNLCAGYPEGGIDTCQAMANNTAHSQAMANNTAHSQAVANNTAHSQAMANNAAHSEAMANNTAHSEAMANNAAHSQAVANNAAHSQAMANNAAHSQAVAKTNPHSEAKFDTTTSGRD